VSVKWILRIESAAIGIVSVVVYLSLSGPPLLLIPALLAPDLSALGYLAGPRVGAVTYNLVHNWALPSALALLAILGHAVWPLQIAAIVAAHVGFDRALGYGLKLPTSFQDTHLGRIGRDRSATDAAAGRGSSPD
jgi:hypothetical protein